MSLDQFLADYGYLAVAVGCFLEGETILVLGGFAAHRGYLDLPLVMLAAFAGSLIGDQLYFGIGRRYGSRMLRRWPRLQATATQVESRLGRHRDTFIAGFRFLYGLRTISPFVIGMTSVSTARYTVLNTAGAAVWAVSVAYLGYLFGHGVEVFLGDVKKYELLLFAAIAALGIMAWLVHRIRARHGARSATPDQPR